RGHPHPPSGAASSSKQWRPTWSTPRCLLGSRKPESSAVPSSTAPLTPPITPGNETRTEPASAAPDPERTVLRQLVDAVTDPILFTSAEGQLLMANARARQLLVADEGASEGHRRA